MKTFLLSVAPHACFLIAWAWIQTASAADIDGVSTFMQKHCLDCHSGGAEEGGLNVQKLGKDLDDEGLFAKWETDSRPRGGGEMPPKDAAQPKSAERAAFVRSLNAQLTAAHAARKATVLRRLNRREYQNTLNDLFGINLKLAEQLPEDGRAGEFDNVGSALGISMVQMRQYLESIEAVLDASIVDAIGPPESKVVRAQLRGYPRRRAVAQ